MPLMSPSERERLQWSLVAQLSAQLMSELVDEFVDSSDSSDSSSSSDDILEEAILLAALDMLNQEEAVESMENVLEHRHADPERFRGYARMDPATFDVLVERLKDEPVFHNKSHNRQMSVDRQVLVALKRFGAHGDGSLVCDIAKWAGIGRGTVCLVTRRVMTAILESNLRPRHVRWPGDEDREAAKQWVEAQGNAALRDGWCMVDGTTIPIFESSQSRKNKYSVNLQVVNTPNRQIIDYAVKFNYSDHDTNCFWFTRLAKERAQLLSTEEWCWSDMGYPLRTWLMTPYQEPTSSSDDNREFNLALSRIRIRSDQAIGYLKGRFPSLKELRVRITSPKDVTYASCWIQACITLHAFSIDTELEANEEWLTDGLAWEKDFRKAARHPVFESSSLVAQSDNSEDSLRAGELVREKLKGRFLEANRGI